MPATASLHDPDCDINKHDGDEGPGGYRFGDFWKLGLPLMAWFLPVDMSTFPSCGGSDVAARGLDLDHARETASRKALLTMISRLAK